MRLEVYLNFPGTCEEAFRFYEAQLGGRVTSLSRHADAPASRLPPDWKDKVLHARLALGDGALLGADIPTAQPTRSAYVTLTLDSTAEAERVYSALGAGGEIFMKMEETFFAQRFAMLRDRFGISWMLLQGLRQST